MPVSKTARVRGLIGRVRAEGWTDALVWVERDRDGVDCRLGGVVLVDGAVDISEKGDGLCRVRWSDHDSFFPTRHQTEISEEILGKR